MQISPNIGRSVVFLEGTLIFRSNCTGLAFGGDKISTKFMGMPTKRIAVWPVEILVGVQRARGLD